VSRSITPPPLRPNNESLITCTIPPRYEKSSFQAEEEGDDDSDDDDDNNNWPDEEVVKDDNEGCNSSECVGVPSPNCGDADIGIVNDCLYILNRDLKAHL
jgi:hypothetical protein